MKNAEFDTLLQDTRRILGKLPAGAYEFELRLQIIAMRLLAEGKPVSQHKLAQFWDMPREQVKTLFDLALARGTLQLDNDGNLIGTALSLIPSRHKIHLDDHTLYAWCAYDAIFAPAVIGQPALIESPDPLTGELVYLTVAADGIREVDPEELVMTYVGLEAEAAGGPESPRCGSMHFFASPENASAWSATRDGALILSPHQAFELIEEFQLKPAREMGLVKLS